VLYMASRDAQLVADELLAAGMRADTPVAIAESVSSNATTRAGVLRDLPHMAARCTGPALLMIGEVLGGISTESVDIPVESRRYTAS